MKLFLKPKEILAIAVISVIVLVMGWLVFSNSKLGVALITVPLATFFILFILMELSKRTHHSLRTEVRNAYAQTDALMGLYHSLPLRRGLPVQRGWVISPDFGQLILQTVENLHPAHIVECGSGISTLICGYGLQKNMVLDRVQSPELAAERSNTPVSIHSLDHDPEFAKKTRSLLKQHSLQKLVEVVDAPLKLHMLEGWELPWYQIEMEDWPPIDLLIVDGPPKNGKKPVRYPAVPFFMPKMSPGGCILVDDAFRGDVVIAIDKWKSAFPDCQFESHFTEKGACLIRLPASG